MIVFYNIKISDKYCIFLMTKLNKISVILFNLMVNKPKMNKLNSILDAS